MESRCVCVFMFMMIAKDLCKRLMENYEELKIFEEASTFGYYLRTLGSSRIEALIIRLS